MSVQITASTSRETLSIQVGSQLRGRRIELEESLRNIATAAAISPSHLSDIENGQSHASLPVLLRLCRALQYPLADLLPRLGGHRIYQASVNASGYTQTVLSHPDLELTVSRLALQQDSRWVETFDRGEDAVLFVLSGDCTIEMGAVEYSLSQHDTADIEFVSEIAILATSDLVMLVCKCTA